MINNIFAFKLIDEEDEADDDEDELNELPHLIHTSFVESNEEMSDGNVNEVEETGKYIRIDPAIRWMWLINRAK